MKEILAETKCPGCGQELTFNPTTQTSVCKYCGKSILINPGMGIDEEDNVSDCPNCGARMEFDISSQKAKCLYCNSEFQILQIEDRLEQKIEAITPFSVTKEAVETAFVEWLAEGDHCPNDIYEKTHSIEVMGAYVPMYIFCIDYQVDWSASIGYNRTENYTERNSDGKLQNRSRTVTDWLPHSDHFQGSACKNAIASSFLRTPPWAGFVLACEVMACGEPRDYDNRYLAGFTPLSLDCSVEAAYKTIIKPKLKGHMQWEVDQIKLGDKKKDVSWSAQYDVKDCSLIYWPLWMIKYHYNDSEYAFVANGCTANETRGSKPQDKSSLAKSSHLFYMAFGLLLCTLVFLFAGVSQDNPLLFGGSLTATTGLFLAAFVVRTKTLKENLNIRQERQQEVLNNINGFLSKRRPHEGNLPAAQTERPVASQHEGEAPTPDGGRRVEPQNRVFASDKTQRKKPWEALYKISKRMALALGGGALLVIILISSLVSAAKNRSTGATPGNCPVPSPLPSNSEMADEYYGFMLNRDPLSEIPEGQDFLYAFTDERKDELGAVISFATAMGNFDSEDRLSPREYIDLAVLCCAGSHLHRDVGYNNFFVDEARVKAVLRDIFNITDLALMSTENYIYKDFGFYGQKSEIKQYLAIPAKICWYERGRGGEYFDLRFDAYEMDCFSMDGKVNWTVKYSGSAELFEINRHLYISSLWVYSEGAGNAAIDPQAARGNEHTPVQEADVLYEKAKALILAGAYNEAIPVLLQVLEYDPSYTEAQALLSDCKIKAGEKLAFAGSYDAALAMFQYAEGADNAANRLADLLCKRADAYRAEGTYLEALSMFEQALEYAPGDAAARAGIDECLSKLSWLQPLQGSWYVWPFDKVFGISQEQYENQLHLRVLHIDGTNIYYDSIKARSWSSYAEDSLRRQISGVSPILIGTLAQGPAENRPVIQYLSGGSSEITYDGERLAIMPPTGGAGDSSGPRLPWEYGDLYTRVPDSLQLVLR